MHINDVYALKAVLEEIAMGKAVSARTVNSLLEAATDELTEYEAHIERLAREDQERKDYYMGAF